MFLESFVVLVLVSQVARLVRFRLTPASRAWLELAAHEARAEGSPAIEVVHLLRALLWDPDVIAALESDAVHVDALRDALEPPALGEPPARLEWSSQISRVIRTARPGPLGVRPIDLLAAARERQDVRDLLARHRRREVPTSLGAYRGASVPMTNVILWDDDSSTMALVVTLLREVFGIPEPRATRIMWVTHFAGAVVVGRYPTSDAERYARLCTERARSAGYPLRVTTGDVARLPTWERMKRIARFA